MRAILFFILLAASPATTLAAPPTPEDTALFHQCINGYLANLKSFEVIDVKYRTGVVPVSEDAGLTDVDFSIAEWRQENRRLTNPHLFIEDEHSLLDGVGFERRVEMSTPDGSFISYNGAVSFTSETQLGLWKIPLPINVSILPSSTFLSERLQGCLKATDDRYRIVDRKNPTFVIDDLITIEFDPNQGYLPVLYNYREHKKDGYTQTNRIIEIKELPGNRWFPMKSAIQIDHSSQAWICEILDLQIGKPFQTTDFDLSLPIGSKFKIDEVDIILTQPLPIRIEDFSKFPQLALQHKFNQLLFSNPRELAKFFYDKPQAIWFLVPYLLFLALPILALIAFRLYRGKSPGKA